jgi:hypothetical protein
MGKFVSAHVELIYTSKIHDSSIKKEGGKGYRNYICIRFYIALQVVYYLMLYYNRMNIIVSCNY